MEPCCNPLFVIASDRRERGNLFGFNACEIASVVSLPRNDIATQSRRRADNRNQSITDTDHESRYSLRHTKDASADRHLLNLFGPFVYFE